MVETQESWVEGMLWKIPNPGRYERPSWHETPRVTGDQTIFAAATLEREGNRLTTRNYLA